MSNEKKIKYICKKCGSEEVRADAYAAWDADTQDWSVVYVGLESIQGHACETCDSNGDGNVELISVPIDYKHPDQKKYNVQWSKTYYVTGIEEVEASSEDEAKAIVEFDIGNYDGPMQYSPDGNEITDITEVKG